MIHWLKEAGSTQIYLKDALKNGSLTAPVLVATTNQTKGIGSRDNSWQGVEGNLAFSFAINRSDLPSDLPLQSASIYFGFLFKQTLSNMGSKVWMKWPNDLYIGDKKCGGVITQIVGENIVCGIGINIVSPSSSFAAIDADIDLSCLMEGFVATIFKVKSWSEVFSGFQLEFEASRNYFVHINNQLKSLKEAVLSSDGSIIIDNERVFSSR